MANLMRVKARWSGFTGSPGYSNFFFRALDFGDPTPAQVNGALVRVNTFFSAIKTLLPPVVTITVQPDVEIIEENNGELQDMKTGTALVAQTGTATAGAYSAASGLVVTWRGSGVHHGRRVRGRTFIVPTANIAYALDGTPQPSTITTMQNASNAMLGSADSVRFELWARPIKAKPDATPPVAARDGQGYEITSATIPDIAAVLRSRRD